eukprot:120274_1
MYHIRPASESKPPVDYTKNLTKPKPKVTAQIPDDPDASLPAPPEGFVFYRIQSGDTLVSLSVRLGISQNKIRRYNSKVCFGHRLTHITGKLLLIPVKPSIELTADLKAQLDVIYSQDDLDRFSVDIGDKSPEENAKYQMRKAMRYHTTGIDDQRADYYLGETNWNVRKAILLWQDDDRWEKHQQIMATCHLDEEEAKQLLTRFNWKLTTAIRSWENEQKKINAENEKYTIGSTEMQQMRKKNSKPTDDKMQSLVHDDEEHNNKKQGGCCM